MPHRSGFASLSQQREGTGGNNVPPSTIAAQIVQNHDLETSGRQFQDHEQFDQLLQEILAHSEAEYADTITSYKLVTIVIKGGLLALAHNDPFNSKNKYISRAITSVKIIELTIRKSPEILFDSSLSDLKDGLRPPLFLTIFSSIVAVLGYENIESLIPFLRRLLYCCIQEVLDTADIWLRAFALISFYQSCVQYIISKLQNVDLASSSSVEITLPTSGCIRDIFSGSESLVALPQGCQTTIRSSRHALIVCLHLLDQTLELSCHHNTPVLVSFRSLGYIEGAVEICIEVKKCFRRLILAWTPKVSDHLLLATYIRSLELVLLASGRSSKQNIVQNSVEPVVVTCLKDLLDARLNTLAVDEFQNSITNTISRVLEIISSVSDIVFPEIALLIQAILQPARTTPESERLAKKLKSICESWLGNFDVVHVATAYKESRQQSVGVHDGHSDNDSSKSSHREKGVPKEHSLRDSDNNQRPLKKRKLLQKTCYGIRHENDPAQIFNFVRQKLAMYCKKDSKITLNWYTSQNKLQRKSLIQSIGLIPCALSNCLEWSAAEKTAPECRICDQDKNYTSSEDWDQCVYHEEIGRIIIFLELLITSPEFSRSKKSRVMMALVLRRVLQHTTDPASFDLISGKIGQWCLKSMHSSSRELRIAAGKLLPVFLSDRLPEYLWRKNRVHALDFLKSMTERQEVYVHETAILIFGRITNVCGSDELNLILLRLTDYLGHPNPFICSVAYNEFIQVAGDKNCSVLDLLSPFWRSVAVTVVKDLLVRPQKAQYLADLLGMSVNQFLLHTQSETLPYLVLTKRKDILQRIATSRKTNVQDMCIQPRRHLAFILALLLRQDSMDTEKYVMDLLCHASSGFFESDFSTLVMLEPVVIACELLKSASDEDKKGKQKVYGAIEKLSIVAAPKSPQGKTSGKREDYNSMFFESHILGIMANFSEVIDARIHQYVPEKIRCLRAVEELIDLAKTELGAALPQIRACLQSALEVRDLRDQAFSAWCKLITNLEHDEDVNWLIEQTFAIIMQYSSSFVPRMQQQAQNIISYLLKKFGHLIKENIATIPSLAGITMMSRYESEIMRLKSTLDLDSHFQAYSTRLINENATNVLQALREFLPFLEKNQEYFHDLVLSQQIPKIVGEIVRGLLDISVRFTEAEGEIISLCSQCLGIIGGLDYNRVETAREKKEILIISNFERANEVIDFVTHLLSNILVKSFLSATSARAQGFLAYVMQELLKFCGYHDVVIQRPRPAELASIYSKWTELPVHTRSTLMPFLSSRYLLTSNLSSAPQYERYPIFAPDISHGVWLRHFVFDLLLRGKGDNAKMIFSVLSRVIRGHDLAIATFLLPFAVLNVLLGSAEKESEQIRNELRTVIECNIGNVNQSQATNIKLCSENIFQVLEYLSRYIQEKKRVLDHSHMMSSKHGKKTSEFEESRDIAQIKIVEQVLSEIPAQLISKRAIECGSYARALFHWEQFIRQQKDKKVDKEAHNTDSWYQTLLEIYLKIDEPDAIEGVSTHLPFMTVDDQVLEHRKAGRWAAVQSWHELKLAEQPNNPNVQLDLLRSLGESGSYDAVLTYADKFLQNATPSGISKIMPRAAEASWVTGDWSLLRKELSKASASILEDFEVCISRALIALADNERNEFHNAVKILRRDITKSLTPSSTASLQACHGPLLKLHILYELEASSGLYEPIERSRGEIITILDKRLEVLGAYLAEKQYILSIRRAVLQLSRLNFDKLDIAALWLKSAQLARKANVTKTAFSSVLRASSLGDDTAKIEHSRLLWKEGYHRQAIKLLEGAITVNAFMPNSGQAAEDLARTSKAQLAEQSFTNAQARLLLGKWLERSGQTPSQTIIDTYYSATKAFTKWDKGYYYIGKHYNKLLESEKLLAPSKQSKIFISGDLAWLVVQHYLLSLHYGTKYYYQTIPRIITLWLDLGTEVFKGGQRPTDTKQHEQRSRTLETMHRQLKKYIERLPAYAFYIALPQVLSRISHPNQKVYEVLAMMIIKMVATHPQQALWSLLAVAKSSSRDRAGRGISLLNKLKEHGKKSRSDNVMSELRAMINNGQKLSDQLLRACEAPVEPKVSHVSLSKDLGFYHKVVPSLLVVPIEDTLTLSLPPVHDVQHMRNHKAFSQKPITIQAFQDDVLVLSSLQRPRKITVRGSDGLLYGLLCKPKDDLRKDQRLMEFNSMINRALKRDVESSKRQLSIKTYGVTPLNEECGTIEWVDNLKPLRDIILQLYRQKNIRIDYSELRVLLAEAAEAPGNVHIFTEQILPKFRPVLHEWFIETFPGPEAWYSARLMFTRTSAVMSIVGHILGLGDRHGENLLLREGHGGVLHVDFNCLFDKGLTFDKPEVVPFRLTHNMTDAMGPYGYEGPFRKAAELTLTILRQHRDTLMTILETFLYDPTADFIGKKKRPVPGVPETPTEVLDSIHTKLSGLLRGESVPLSVEGYVEALTAMATDPQRLAAMYIGWCAFL